MAQSSLGGVFPRTGDLEIVIVHSGDGGIGEMGDLTGRSTDPASDVEDFHPLFEPDLGGEVVFVTSELGGVERAVSRVESLKKENSGTCGLEETFSLEETGEMERSCPSVLVQLGSSIIVPCIHRPIRYISSRGLSCVSIIGTDH
jgi:hypothetical protein